MDAVEYVKTVRRLCASHSDCDTCKLYGNDCCMFSFMEKEPEKAVLIVEQWAKDHPVKTRQSEFLKMFPKAEMDGDVLSMCPKYVEDIYRPKEDCCNTTCDDCKLAYWLMEVSE